jgi:hypothetical protein
MAFQELALSLPNGFHDAELRRFEMDYVHRRLEFELDVWIGDMGDDKSRELYRPCRLMVADVAYLVIEPPDSRYPWQERSSIRIDTGEGQPSQSESYLPDSPEGTTITWMYLADLNRFLLFAAGDAELEWTGPEENRT